jgi:hypothetical protein
MYDSRGAWPQKATDIKVRSTRRDAYEFEHESSIGPADRTRERGGRGVSEGQGDGREVAWARARRTRTRTRMRTW